MNKARVIPNPNSKILAAAVVGGASLLIPPGSAPPPGMAAVILYVPLRDIVGKNLSDIQADLGVPWFMGEGEPYWFDGPK